jgi:glycosyltransferase involved in cell wall biosynthesis
MPMPTLLAINNYYYRRGGAETVYLDHNRMLEGLGWQVVPFAMRHPENLPTPWSKYFVDEIEFGQPYSFREKVARIPKVVYSFEARRKLSRLLANVQVDVCHAHNVYHHISPSILGLLRARGIPTVLTLHDLKIACPAYHMLAHDGICERCRGGRLHNVLLNRCIKGSAALSAIVMVEAVVHRLLGSYARCVDRFIVPSRFYVEKLCEWGMPRRLFNYIPNFIDTERYGPSFAAGRGFVYFGRVSPEKGLRTLVQAAADARCPLVIAGSGPQLQELRALAAELKAEVAFPGFLSGDELHTVVRDSRAVVLPSEWYENAPMSVLEAYALGKPIIGARIGGIPELVRENETGVCFTSGDRASLAAALTGMTARTDGEIEGMGRRAREWVESAFTVAAYRDRIMSAYSELGVGAGRSLPVQVSV